MDLGVSPKIVVDLLNSVLFLYIIAPYPLQPFTTLYIQHYLELLESDKPFIELAK